MTSGFYKKHGDDRVLFAPLNVQSKNYTLVREKRNDYILPIDGWNWFDSVELAYEAYGVVLPEEESDQADLQSSYVRAKWGDWRREMSGLPSFLLLFQLVDQSTVPGVQSAWSYFVGLLFKVHEDESVIPDFAPLWTLISNGAGINQDTKNHWARIAEKHDLPSDFVDVIRA